MADLEGVQHAEHETLLFPLVVGILQGVLRPVPLAVVQALPLFRTWGHAS